MSLQVPHINSPTEALLSTLTVAASIETTMG